MIRPSRTLLDSIKKLKECIGGFAVSTAALAPYPVGVIGTSTKKKKTNETEKKHNSEDI